MLNNNTIISKIGDYSDSYTVTVGIKYLTGKVVEILIPILKLITIFIIHTTWTVTWEVFYGP